VGDLNENMTNHYQHPQDATMWSAKFIRVALKLTLNLRICRNKQTQGNTGCTSIVEKDNVALKIQLYYRVIKPLILPQDQWLFQLEETRKLQEIYLSQVAWTDGVERVCRDLIVVTGFVQQFPRLKILTF